MGIMNDLRKLLFGAKSTARSVGRSASEKSDEFMESIKEKGSELYESSRKSVEKYSDKTLIPR